MDLTARRVAGEFSRIKPEIYQTKDGKVIVEDELLNFIVVKMRTLSHDDIVSLVTSSFSSERIESSKSVLSELLPKNKRWIAHRGQKKDINNVKMCLQVLNECGDDIPRFVSHFLDELPPVTFNHIDVSVLLGKMQQINADIDYLKRTLDTQTTAYETLRVVSATLDNRLTAVEKPPNSGTTPMAPCLSAVGLCPVPGPSSATVEKLLDTDPTTANTPSATAATGETHDSQLAQPVDMQPPAWNTVVKEGRRRRKVPENSAPRRPNPHTAKTPVRHERKKTGIIGTGVVSNILAVKTKMVNVFATKFDPNLDANTLSDYLKEKLGREVKCRKIETVQSRFSSFCVTAECNDVAEMFDPQLWPAGSFVRRYYEPRRPRGAVLSGPEETPRSQDAGLLPCGDAGVAAVSVEEARMASCPAVSNKEQ